MSRMRRFWPLPLILIAIGVALSFVHTPVQVALPLPGGTGTYERCCGTSGSSTSSARS